VDSNEYLNSGEHIFPTQDGKPIGDFDQFAEKHFSEFGKPKQAVKVIPGGTGTGSTSYGTTAAELFKQLRTAKTPEEKAIIQEKLKAFD